MVGKTTNSTVVAGILYLHKVIYSYICIYCIKMFISHSVGILEVMVSSPNQDTLVINVHLMRPMQRLELCGYTEEHLVYSYIKLITSNICLGVGFNMSLDGLRLICLFINV